MNHFLILRCLLLIPATLFCQVMLGQYYFDKLTEENGLSDNRVTCFLKDKTGFLWIGTKNGLNRYDGHSFKVFKPTRGNSISNEIINDIVQDASGNIWAATMEGLNIYDPHTNKWQSLRSESSEIKDDLPSYLIWDLAISEDNKIWIVSDVWELSVYDPVKKTFTYYDWPSFKQQRKFDGFGRYRSIQKIVYKNKNEWWLGTSIGLCSINTLTGQFTFYGSGYAATVVDIKYDSSRHKVFSVIDDGRLFYYDEAKKYYGEIKTGYREYPAKKWVTRNSRADRLLMTHPNGLLEVNLNSNAAELIKHRTNLSSSLLPGATTVIYKDNEGMVWVGGRNGINYFNSRNRGAAFVPLTIASDKEAEDGMSAAFYDTTDRKYYITSIHSKELFIIDDLTGNISTVNSVDGKRLSACTNICSDGRNNLWLLTETNVYKYNRQTKRFSLFPTPNNGRPVIFHDLAEDKKGNYWLATWEDGVYRYNSKENSFYKLTRKDSISAKSITALYNDPREDAVWFGTFSLGAYRYDLEENNLINYTETDANPDYQQLNLIRDIESDASGKLWMPTVGAGIYVYRHGLSYEKSFRHITVKNGLPRSSYYSIAADDKNRLWLLSAKGLSAIDQNGKFLYAAEKHPAFSFANYAPDNRYPKRIFFNRAKKELLVPVSGGLLFFYPDKIIPATKFPVVITDISVDGRSVIYDSPYLKNGTITMSASSNSLSFQFSALSYSDHGSLRYEYKLHQRDATWKSIGNTTTLNFPGLSPGQYTFMIRARNTDGRLSFNTFSLPFFIKPPFWKTTWFIAALAILILLGLYYWIRSLRRKVKEHKILTYFATSLYGQNTVDDIFWDVAKNCISQLRLEDCVIYQYDAVRKVLVQKAAYGPKNPHAHEIKNVLEIPLGKGIVGSTAIKGSPVIIKNTAGDHRYIVDDKFRKSEIAVPLFINGKLFGVIDSEHSSKNFYTPWHLRLLKKIAVICTDKISKFIAIEKVRGDIARDLHDEVGSALSSISMLSKVALSRGNGNAKIAGYLAKIKESTATTMENMSDIVWAINPKNDKLESLMTHMKEFASDICEARNIDLEFKLPSGLEKTSLDLAKRKNLFLIYKEAVNNAVKYSKATLLTTNFLKKDDLLTMVVTDNGNGFNIKTVNRGNGINNMNTRAAECGGVLRIETVPGGGTTIWLEMPIPRFGDALSAGTY